MRLLPTALSAGSGLHRFVMSRSELRADLARLDDENDGLVCALVDCTVERDEARRDRDGFRQERDDVRELLAKAECLINDLDGQVRDLERLREDNRALRAALQNKNAVHELPRGADGEDCPDVVYLAREGLRVVPLHEAPMAATDPSRTPA